MTSEEERYHINDWTPPWLDNGEALLTVVLSARHLDNPLSWQIICSLLKRQLEIDLRIAKEVNFMFNPDVNEEALPYMWDADIKMKNLQDFYNAIPEELLEREESEDEDDDY
jgi:hypothetical protein